MNGHPEKVVVLAAILSVSVFMTGCSGEEAANETGGSEEAAYDTGGGEKAANDADGSTEQSSPPGTTSPVTGVLLNLSDDAKRKIQENAQK